MSYQLLSESFFKARKPHSCIWCGQRIAPGEKYRAEASIYDGDMQYHKWHLECSKASKEYFAADKYDGSFQRGDNPLGFAFWEDYEESTANPPEA